ncbi:MAG: hypothetical protein GX025_04810 [Clostridiales bacterium]|nr:hypothetical protein [Clostridiales bacterium]
MRNNRNCKGCNNNRGGLGCLVVLAGVFVLLALVLPPGFWWFVLGLILIIGGFWLLRWRR